MNNPVKFGTNYGGFYLPYSLELDSECVFYSVGAGEDISFDVCMTHHTGMTAHIFDPTPRAIKHVRDVQQVLSTLEPPDYKSQIGGGNPDYWTIIINNKIDPNKLVLHEYGLYDKDETMMFYLPDVEAWVSHSLMENMRVNKKYIDVPVKCLTTIMNDLGHEKIDIIKIDIEGAELVVLKDMLDHNIIPTYLCVDFDLARKSKQDTQTCTDFIRNNITKHYNIIHDDNWDISFIKK